MSQHETPQAREAAPGIEVEGWYSERQYEDAQQQAWCDGAAFANRETPSSRWIVNISKVGIGLGLGIVLMALMGCATTTTAFEIGAGSNNSFGNEGRPWQDSGAGAKLAVRVERKRMYCEYAHYSQWMKGWPFNNEAESSLDHIGCGLRFTLGGRR